MTRVLRDFLGSWTLERDIVQADGGQGRFDGTAVWSETTAGALHAESGTLHLPGQGSFAAARRYVWTADLTVFFDDGRFFHRVPPEGGDAAHWCDPDRYEVHYDFTGWPDWQTVWRVRGPRKDYTMTTRYRRSAG